MNILKSIFLAIVFLNSASLGAMEAAPETKYIRVCDLRNKNLFWNDRLKVEIPCSAGKIRTVVRNTYDTKLCNVILSQYILVKMQERTHERITHGRLFGDHEIIDSHSFKHAFGTVVAIIKSDRNQLTEKVYQQPKDICFKFE